MENSNIGPLVADRLKYTREFLGYSPEKAAELSEGRVSPSYIRRVENSVHSPTIEIIHSLVYAYGGKLWTFFKAIEEPDAEVEEVRKKPS